MERKTIYLDFDGVILDSEERMLDRKIEKGFTEMDKNTFNAYFEYTKQHPEEWDYILGEASEINDSAKIIRELESLKKDLAIITKCHTKEEAIKKLTVIRNKLQIVSPVFIVPAGIKKNEIVIPNGQLLVDDSKKNIKRWIESGGEGLIFDKNLEEDTEEKVRSLQFLLKR